MGFLDKIKKSFGGGKEKADADHSSKGNADDKEFRFGDESIKSTGEPPGSPPPPP